MTHEILVCTCSGWNMADTDSHEWSCCDLFDDADFINGDCTWDPDTASLVYDMSDDEYMDEVEIEPDAYTAIDPVYDADDLLTIVLTELDGGAPDKDYWVKVANYIGAEVLSIMERLSNQADIEMVDVDILEKFGAQVLHLSDKDIPPVYDCTCQEAAHVYCGACGVMRCNKGNGPWVPTYERRKREVGMFLLGEFYTCKHTTEKRFACRECGVQRWMETAAWSFWNAAKVGDIVLKTDTKPIVVQSSHVKTAWDDDEDYDWFGGYGGTLPKLGTGGITTTTYQKCRHYGETVTLPDGTPIMCSSAHKRKADDAKPDFGCYMHSGWEPDWFAYWLNWTDYGLPNMSLAMVERIVDDLLVRARDGNVVEIGCMGGHGRTGSLLALLALKAGAKDADEAMAFVWNDYCKHAIEGDKQEWYVQAFDNVVMKGIDAPKMPVAPCTKYQHTQLFDKGEKCPTNCKLADTDYKTWLEDKVKKAVTGSKSSPIIVKHTPAAPNPAGTPAYNIQWSTPIPENDGKYSWCALDRHHVLWWRHETCDCSYWAGDVKRFEKAGCTQSFFHKDPNVDVRGAQIHELPNKIIKSCDDTLSSEEQTPAPVG